MSTMTVTQQSSSSLFAFSTQAGQKNTVRTIASSITLNLRDSFQMQQGGNSLVRRTVEQMRSAINVPLSQRLPLNSQTLNLASIEEDVNLKIIRMTLGEKISYPTPKQVTADIERAGGQQALEPWLVDGWTQLQSETGGKYEINMNGQNSKMPASGDAQQNLLTSIGRFGLSESDIAAGGESLRESLRAAASSLSKDQPQLASSIDYALQDALAKVSAWESPSASGAQAGGDFDFTRQTEINMRQARQVTNQLNLGDSGWGIESLAQDLAVFGLDLTAMNDSPEKLVETVRERSMELLNKLAESAVGTHGDLEATRRQITGASARLVNGLQSSAGSFISASMGVSSSNVSAKVDGVSVNASAMVAVGNVIVDPLVLDLNGDGIDLKSAEDGVEFDMNGDGTKTQMGFIRGDDALLFIDEYGDGVVRDGKQLFGNADGYANGFEKLRTYDDNGDGVIDENDAIWDSLRVWVEKTEDGVCEAGETMSLSEAGVKSINVGYENVREDDGKGNLIGQVGSFQRDDGTEGLAADVWLQELARQSTMDK